MPDPYDWNPPDLPPEQITDADWLRDVLLLLEANRWSLIKTRRALIRKRRWSGADWYMHWPEVGSAQELALASR